MTDAGPKKSGMSKHLINALKLLFVAGLLYWVFTNVPWQDSYVTTDPTTKAETVTFGEIQGPWDQPVVKFLAEGKSEPVSLTTGSNLSVYTGIPTYWKNLHVGWFVLGALCYILSVMFASTRWWWLLSVNKLPVTWWAALKFSWIGIFFNNVVPGQTGGDLVKAIYVMKRSHGARVPAMMSVVVDRIMGLASLALLAAIAVLFYLDRPGFTQLAAVLWAILGAVVLLGVIAFSRRIRSFIRLTAILEMLPEKISILLKRIDHAVFFYRSHKLGMAVWLFAGIFNHISSVCSYALVGKALGVGIPFVDYFVLIPIIVIVSAIPIAPNGWGVGEFMFKKLFGEFGAAYLVGIPQAEAVAKMGARGVTLSLVYRLTLTALSMIGGLLFFFDKDKVTREDMAREVAEEEKEEAALDDEMGAASDEKRGEDPDSHVAE
jgi:uncharacterized protein (TIRG00374 family)